MNSREYGTVSFGAPLNLIFERLVLITGALQFNFTWCPNSGSAESTSIRVPGDANYVPKLGSVESQGIWPSFSWGLVDPNI